MSFLGDIGSLYMLFLISLLIIGLGMISKGFIGYLLNVNQKNTVKRKGADQMQNVNWLKLSLYSLIGIIVSLMILSFISSSGIAGNNPSTSYNTSLSGSLLGTGSSFGTTGSNSMSTVGTISFDGSTLTNNFNILQQQMNQMQTQIYQLQLIIQNMNTNQSTSSGTTNSGSSGSSSGSMPMM